MIFPSSLYWLSTMKSKASSTRSGTNVKTFVDEQVSKFLLGERSFDEWDSYVAEVEALGLADLKAVHESAMRAFWLCREAVTPLPPVCFVAS